MLRFYILYLPVQGGKSDFQQAGSFRFIPFRIFQHTRNMLRLPLQPVQNYLYYRPNIHNECSGFPKEGRRYPAVHLRKQSGYAQSHFSTHGYSLSTAVVPALPKSRSHLIDGIRKFFGETFGKSSCKNSGYHRYVHEAKEDAPEKPKDDKTSPHGNARL